MKRLITKREQMIEKIGTIGVRVRKDTIEATNGHIFGKITNKYPIDPGDYPNVEAEEFEADTIVINAGDLKKMKIPKDKIRPIIETMLLAKHNGHLCLTTTDLSSTARVYPEERNFPDKEYSDCVSQGEPVIEVKIKKETLLETFKLFEKESMITMRIYAEEEAIEFTHENSEYKTEVLAMPCS